MREANDRGYRCVVLDDCCASYFPEFHKIGLKMITAQGGIFGWVSNSSAVGMTAVTRPFWQREQRDVHQPPRPREPDFNPLFFTPGDWNAFFGFGTNILVNMLTLTALLRFVLKMPDELVFGRILPATGLMLCLSTFYYAWLAYRLAQEDGANRCLRAAFGHQRSAHVHRHLRDHAADHAEDRRSHEGLVGGTGLGFRPKFCAHDRRLCRVMGAQSHAPRGPAGHAGGRFDHVHLHAPGAGDVHDAGHSAIPACFAIILAKLVRAGYAISRRVSPAGLVAIGVGTLIAWGIERAAGSGPRRHEPRQAGRRRVRQLRLRRYPCPAIGHVFSGLPVPRRHPGDSDPVRHLRPGRSHGQRRERPRRPATNIRRRACSPPTASSA